MHQNQLWSHDTDSISIPTTAAAASLGVSSAPLGVSRGAGRKPLLAPLPVVKGGAPAISMLSQRSGNVPTSTAGTALVSS